MEPPWLQPVATGRKSGRPDTPENKRKPLPSVATRCRKQRMVRRGSPVRVRKRASQRPRKPGPFLSGRPALLSTCSGVKTVLEKRDPGGLSRLPPDRPVDDRGMVDGHLKPNPRATAASGRSRRRRRESRRRSIDATAPHPRTVAMIPSPTRTRPATAASPERRFVSASKERARVVQELIDPRLAPPLRGRRASAAHLRVASRRRKGGGAN
jgi:hypothetical protein